MLKDQGSEHQQTGPPIKGLSKVELFASAGYARTQETDGLDLML
jgi:hypothetical protein